MTDIKLHVWPELTEPFDQADLKEIANAMERAYRRNKTIGDAIHNVAEQFPGAPLSGSFLSAMWLAIDAYVDMEEQHIINQALAGTLTEPKFGEWSPIETAPKDGTAIDIFVRGFRLVDVWFDVDDKCWTCGLPDSEITHWMPQPAPPK